MIMKKCSNCVHWAGIHHSYCVGINLAGDHIATPNNGAVLRVDVSNDAGLGVLLKTGPNFSCSLHQLKKKEEAQIDDADFVVEDESNFSVMGTKYRAMFGNGFSDCDVCAFSELNCMAMKNRPSCSNGDRADNKDVYFFKVK